MPRVILFSNISYVEDQANCLAVYSKKTLPIHEKHEEKLLLVFKQRNPF